MNDMAKELFGNDLHISIEDPDVKRMVAWIMRLENSARRLEIDLNKGLLVVGPGSRKNRIMDLIRCFTFAPDYKHPFEKVTCSYISNAFSAKGPAAIEQYISNSVTKKNAICFTELGREMISQHYGVSCYAMDQILHNRCELSFQGNMVTHVTTSLTSEEIEVRYGKAMRDCLRENFNRVIIE
jgi:hypothetical protein